MLFVGSLLALVCGLANSAAAALQKHEAIRSSAGREGLRLLAVLIRRRWWLLAIALSLLAWLAEAFAFGLAPVPVVTTLRSAGRGGLIFAGHKWLGERFGTIELSGVLLLAIGAGMTAASVASTKAASPPISNVDELLVAGISALVALALSRSRNGVIVGTAVGVLFVATGIFTKEIGDGFVREGTSSVPKLLVSPGPWIMVLMSVWGIAMLQRAFQRANAATVSAASTTVSANGLILAGATLYGEQLARGLDLIILLVGLVLSAAGAVALVARGFLDARRL